jgi:uncharacterized protein DUF6285
MQQLPTAAELLSTVVEVLTDEVVPALTGPVQHNARVAANLVAIVERELRLGGDAATREHAAIAALLDDGTSDLAISDLAISDLAISDLAISDLAPSDLARLRARLAAALRSGMADDETTDEAVWRTLMAAVRDDLSIAKPGHDAWGGD